MSEKSTIRAVLWDADGVLQHPSEGLWDHIGGLVGHDMIATVFNADELGPMTGERPLAEAVAEVLDAHGIDADVDEVLRSWQFLRLDQDALSVVQAVRASGIECHLATNQEFTRVAYMRDTLAYGKYLDRLFFSAELGVKKPDPRYWVAISEALDIPPADLLFIDDLASNVAAARSVGLRAERHDPDSGATGLRRILADHGIQVAAA